MGFQLAPLNRQIILIRKLHISWMIIKATTIKNAYNKYLQLDIFLWLVPLIITLIYANWCGLARTTDSRFFIEIADNFEYHGLNHPLLKYKPPGYALLIHFSGIEKIFYINLLCFISFQIILIRQIRKEVNSKSLRIAAILSMCLATPIIMNHHFIWSEPLANILILALFMLFRNQPFNTGSKIISILIISNILILTRHSGLFIVTSLFVAHSINNFNQSTILKTLGLLPLSISSSVAWHIFKYDAFTYRASEFSAPGFLDKYYHNFSILVESIGNWFIPQFMPTNIKILLVLIIILCIATLRFLNKIEFSKHHQTWMLAIFLFVLQLMSVFEIPYDGEKYLSPIFPILFFILFTLADQFSKYKSVIIVSVIWSLYPVTRTLKNVQFWHTIECKKEQTIKE